MEERVRPPTPDPPIVPLSWERKTIIAGEWGRCHGSRWPICRHVKILSQTKDLPQPSPAPQNLNPRTAPSLRHGSDKPCTLSPFHSHLSSSGGAETETEMQSPWQPPEVLAQEAHVRHINNISIWPCDKPKPRSPQMMQNYAKSRRKNTNKIQNKIQK